MEQICVFTGFNNCHTSANASDSHSLKALDSDLSIGRALPERSTEASLTIRIGVSQHTVPRGWKEDVEKMLVQKLTGSDVDQI